MQIKISQGASNKFRNKKVIGSKMKITHFIDYAKFKIYINGLIHIVYPRVRNIRVQAWREGTNNPVYKIEIKSHTRTNEYHYDKKELWELI